MTTYFPVATSSTRVRIIYSEAMLQNVPLTNVATYVVATLGGVVVPVTNVALEQATNTVSVVLTLGSPLATTTSYQVTLGPGLISLLGHPVSPLQTYFRFVGSTKQIIVKNEQFSGEATGGLLGSSPGSLFFSPALTSAAANSVIQLDSVATCTKAYDEYHFPAPPDPNAFVLWAPTVAETTRLNDLTSALWAPFPRLCEARFSLGISLTDAVSVVVDGPAVATLREVFDKSFVSYLNNPAWTLYDGVSTTTPPIFILTNNLGPIPPGPTVVIPL